MTTLVAFRKHGGSTKGLWSLGLFGPLGSKCSVFVVACEGAGSIANNSTGDERIQKIKENLESRLLIIKFFVTYNKDNWWLNIIL